MKGRFGKKLSALFLLCKSQTPKKDPATRWFQLWDKKKLLHAEAIDHVLEHGLVSSSWTFHGVIFSKLCRVELQPGHTKDDLIAFFSQIKPCPVWDAFIAAESKGLVKITDSTH